MFTVCNIISAAFGMFLYVTFRSGIYSYLRVSRHSKSYIKKMRKGFFNYLLYANLRKVGAIGHIYVLNLVFLTVQTLYFITSLSLGYLSFMRIPLITMSTISCIIHIPAMIYTSIYDAIENYGGPFVLIAEQKDSGKLYSSIVYYFVPLITIVFTYSLFTES